MVLHFGKGMTVKCNPTFDSALLATWPIGSQSRFIYLAYECKTVGKKGTT